MNLDNRMMIQDVMHETLRFETERGTSIKDTKNSLLRVFPSFNVYFEPDFSKPKGWIEFCMTHKKTGEKIRMSAFFKR